MKNASSPLNFWRWFDPRSHSTSTFAFILNRITALGLTFYLFLHLIVLGKLAQGPQAFDDFVRLAHSPVIKVGEMLVIAAGLIHGLNGIRIALTTFNIGTKYQKQIFAGMMALAVIGIIIFGIKMFAAQEKSMLGTRSTPKPREGAFLWLFKIVAGIMIVALLGLHFLVNHLFAPQGLLSYAEVYTYYQNPLIPIVEVAFLLFVISHALVGLRSILLDLNPSDGMLKMIDILFWLAGIGFSIYGIWLVITVVRAGA